MLAFIYWFVHVIKYFEEIKLLFLLPGHAKNKCDGKFRVAKNEFTK